MHDSRPISILVQACQHYSTMTPDDCEDDKEVREQLEHIQNTLTELVEKHQTQLRESIQELHYDGVELRSRKMMGQMPLQSQDHVEELWDAMLPQVMKVQCPPQYVPLSFCDMIGLTDYQTSLIEPINECWKKTQQE